MAAWNPSTTTPLLAREVDRVHGATPVFLISSHSASISGQVDGHRRPFLAKSGLEYHRPQAVWT